MLQMLFLQNALRALEAVQVLLEYSGPCIAALAGEEQIPAHLLAPLQCIAYASTRLPGVPELRSFCQSISNRFGEGFVNVDLLGCTAGALQADFATALANRPPSLSTTSSCKIRTGVEKTS
jgi:hypothetical protein